MHLEADAIERHATRLKVLRQGVNRIRLGVYRFGVVVVVKELCARIGSVRPAKCLLDVRRTFTANADARSVVPNRAWHGAVVFKRLVDHVPRPDVACEGLATVEM